MPARSPDSATRSEGRRLISLRGGNRGPGRVRRCRALELWGFEGHGQWAEAQAWWLPVGRRCMGLQRRGVPVHWTSCDCHRRRCELAHGSGH